MKKHHKKHIKEGSVAEEAMESPAEEAAEEAAEQANGQEMKRGGDAKMKAKKSKKNMKPEGHKSKARLDRPAKKATGGAVDSTDAGVTPSSPFAVGSPQRGSKK